jgi:5-(carboxyamino)imidazole ribonucleotide mutase
VQISAFDARFVIGMRDYFFLFPLLVRSSRSELRLDIGLFFIIYLDNDIHTSDWKVGRIMSVQVAVIMGSKSDWDTMEHACAVLDELELSYEKKVVSAHRTPDLMFSYAEEAAGRGIRVIIAGAGGAAHLPGMVAAKTILPVIGVPVQSKALNGLDSLLSIVQMPGGIPVATVAIGKAGAVNAGLLAAQIIGAFDPEVQQRVQLRRDAIRDEVLESSDSL